MKEDKNNLTEKEYLENYDAAKYYRHSISVDCLVFMINEIENSDIRKLNEKSLQVLLINRKEHPFIDKWTLPGSFLLQNETLENCYVRTLSNKTRITHAYLEQLYTFDEINRDPRSRILTIAYMGLLDNKSAELEKNDNMAWFDLKIKQEKNKVIMKFENSSEKFNCELETDGKVIKISDSGKLGFDHAKIIYYGLNRLRNKIEYTDIAFSMLPEEFTKAELQQVFEVILDKKFTKANFQRKINGRIKPISKFKTGGFRPAQLYKFLEIKTDKSLK